jgi:transmembrane sensor
MTGTDPHPPFADEPAAWEALARWLDGGSPPDEALAVQAWLAADPARAALVQALDPHAPAPVAPAAEVDVEAALRSVRLRMDGGAGDEGSVPDVIPLTPRRLRVASASPSTVWAARAMRIAAVLAVVVGGGLLGRRAMKGGASAEPQAFATAVGQRRAIDLPDGTHVVLGPGSRLAVAAGYGHGARTVDLTGEALFEVRHNAARPFTVRTGAAEIRDLGTRFTVRTGASGGVRVAVSEGSVRLAAVGGRGEGDAGAVVLRGGERGQLAAGDGTATKAGAATDDDLAWTQGRLVFRDAPLDQVAGELRRWYGIELQVTDSALARRPLTASFGADPPREVVRVVALALGAEVRMHGDTAFLRPAGAPAR